MSRCFDSNILDYIEIEPEGVEMEYLANKDIARLMLHPTLSYNAMISEYESFNVDRPHPVQQGIHSFDMHMNFMQVVRI